jgi:hypothetical protein
MTDATRSHFRKPPLRPRRAHGLSRTPLMALIVAACLAVGFVVYLLWPRWPATTVAPDAPTYPITVADVAFNVPPAAIRVTVQRRPGAHERVDLAFLWPSLEPPDPGGRSVVPTPEGAPVPAQPTERLFVTISNAGNTLAPAERVRAIYPRYVAADAAAGPDGLLTLPFREGTPYQGEDLIYEAPANDGFLVRCTRDGAGPTPGTCLYERRIEHADIVVRFPRDWLADWRTVATRIDRLIASLRPRS